MKFMQESPPPDLYRLEIFDLQRFAEGSGEKTEEPTDKKRRDARKKGQVARSQELNAAFVLLAGFFVIRILWEYIYGNIAGYSADIFANLATVSISTESIMQLFLGMVILLAKTAFPVMLGILIFALGVNFFQVGFVISTENLSRNSKISTQLTASAEFFQSARSSNSPSQSSKFWSLDFSCTFISKTKCLLCRILSTTIWATASRKSPTKFLQWRFKLSA